MSTAPSSSHQQSINQSVDSTYCGTVSNGDSKVCCMCDRLYTVSTHAVNKVSSPSVEGYAYCGRCSAAIAAVSPKERSLTNPLTVTRNVPQTPSQPLGGTDLFTYPILKR
jgi:hypothetical protein